MGDLYYQQCKRRRDLEHGTFFFHYLEIPNVFISSVAELGEEAAHR